MKSENSWIVWELALSLKAFLALVTLSILCALFALHWRVGSELTLALHAFLTLVALLVISTFFALDRFLTLGKEWVVKVWLAESCTTFVSDSTVFVYCAEESELIFLVMVKREFSVVNDNLL